MDKISTRENIEAFSKVTEVLESEIPGPIEIIESRPRKGEVDEHMGYDQNALIESLVEEMGDIADRDKIEQVVGVVGRKYRNATVKNFLPILIRREVLKRLQ